MSTTPMRRKKLTPVPDNLFSGSFPHAAASTDYDARQRLFARGADGASMSGCDSSPATNGPACQCEAIAIRADRSNRRTAQPHLSSISTGIYAVRAT